MGCSSDECGDSVEVAVEEGDDAYAVDGDDSLEHSAGNDLEEKVGILDSRGDSVLGGVDNWDDVGGGIRACLL